MILSAKILNITVCIRFILIQAEYSLMEEELFLFDPNAQSNSNKFESEIVFFASGES